LQQYADVVVAGTVQGGREALAQTQALRPDAVLIALTMSDLSGLEVMARLRAAFPEVGIIALTLLDTDGYRRAALAAGADAFVAKATLRMDLLPAIRQVRQARQPWQKATE
jgi:DNA-binding NarL/FixJ family response regulator